MDLLAPEHLNDGRRGKVPYLERVIRCNLTKLSRLLRISSSAKTRNSLGTLWNRLVRAMPYLSIQPFMGFSYYSVSALDSRNQDPYGEKFI
jgi:hypothetical protein